MMLRFPWLTLGDVWALNERQPVCVLRRGWKTVFARVRRFDGLRYFGDVVDLASGDEKSVGGVVHGPGLAGWLPIEDPFPLREPFDVSAIERAGLLLPVSVASRMLGDEWDARAAWLPSRLGGDVVSTT